MVIGEPLCPGRNSRWAFSFASKGGGARRSEDETGSNGPDGLSGSEPDGRTHCRSCAGLLGRARMVTRSASHLRWAPSDCSVGAAHEIGLVLASWIVRAGNRRLEGESAMNQRIRTIVVPLDLTTDADAIVSWAIEWAQLKHARLIFLHVLAPVHTYASPVFVDPGGYDELYAQARKLAEERLSWHAAQAKERGVEASVHLRVGPGADEILAMARDLGTGLIIVGTHGRTGLAHVFLGSTAEKVVRLAQCPVFVVKELLPAPM